MHIHPSSPDSSLFLEPEESAAIKIQAGFRGYRVRKNLQHNQQSRKPKVNGYVVSRHHRSHHHHHHHHHQQTQNNQRGAVMEQTSNKTSANAAIATVPSPTGSDGTTGDDEDEVQQKCATKIQAGVRGFLVRKKQKLAVDAATKIQAGFRGFKARKDVQKLKQK